MIQLPNCVVMTRPNFKVIVVQTENKLIFFQKKYVDLNRKPDD